MKCVFNTCSALNQDYMAYMSVLCSQVPPSLSALSPKDVSFPSQLQAGQVMVRVTCTCEAFRPAVTCFEILHYNCTGELRFGVRIDVFVYTGDKQIMFCCRRSRRWLLVPQSLFLLSNQEIWIKSCFSHKCSLYIHKPPYCSSTFGAV